MLHIEVQSINLQTMSVLMFHYDVSMILCDLATHKWDGVQRDQFHESIYFSRMENNEYRGTSYQY